MAFIPKIAPAQIRAVKMQARCEIVVSDMRNPFFDENGFKRIEQTQVQ